MNEFTLYNNFIMFVLFACNCPCLKDDDVDEVTEWARNNGAHFCIACSIPFQIICNHDVLRTIYVYQTIQWVKMFPSDLFCFNSNICNNFVFFQG